jgi:hypothetical protein
MSGFPFFENGGRRSRSRGAETVRLRDVLILALWLCLVVSLPFLIAAIGDMRIVP